MITPPLDHALYCKKRGQSEKTLTFLKIDASGADKLWIQFALPYEYINNLLN